MGQLEILERAEKNGAERNGVYEDQSTVPAK